jgi:hypothetical protein
MNLPSFNEMFDEVDKAPSKEAKIAALHKHSGKILKTFLGYVFDPNVKWLIPNGTPPFTKSEDDPSVLRGRIWQDFRLMQHFNSTGPYPQMKQGKREDLFISFLQSVDAEDAKLLCFVKDNRKLPQKSVNRALIKQAFPLLEAKWGAEVEAPKKPAPVKEAVKAVTAPLESSSVGSLQGFGNFDDVNENSVNEIIPSKELLEELKTQAKPKPVKAPAKKTTPALKAAKPKKVTKTA